MKSINTLLSIAALSIAGLCLLVSNPALSYVQSPYLDERVNAGELESVDKRLPATPLTMGADMNNTHPGQHGGKLRMLMGKDKDIRRMVVFGYSRLVGYNDNLELVSDIVESYENVDNKVFTFNLRPGHKWSDGAPFTSEDFKFYWEDIANNEDLMPFGAPKSLQIDGEVPTVEFPDALTVIYRWTNPNPYFLAELAAPSPLFIYQPKHYLTQFHANYTDRAALDTAAQRRGSQNWAGGFLKKARQYKLTNPDLPSLQPWVITTKQPAELYVFKRNPYFHRVDANGLQLPYIDEVLMNIASSSLIPAKTGSGETDLQGHYLRLDNFTFLKAGESRNDYKVKLWSTVNGAHKALFPNLNSNDAVWRQLVRDVRFRRALSMGVDRAEINQVIYHGLANESSNTVLPACDLHEEDLQHAYATYDLSAANALLDEIGLTDRNNRGIRIRADGKPLEIIIHSAGESTEETDILELVHDSWLKLGIKIYTKPSQREVFRERVFSGGAMMSIWSGLENAMPTADMSPHELAPTSQNQYQWPKWGQHFETKGVSGEAPQLAGAQELFELNEAWKKSTDHAEKRGIWSAMLKTYCEEVYSIGIVNTVPQPIVVNTKLRNVPEKGVYSWSPTAYFGVYHPDVFWFEQ